MVRAPQESQRTRCAQGVALPSASTLRPPCRGACLLTGAQTRLRETPAPGRGALRARRGCRAQNSLLQSCRPFLVPGGPCHTRCPGSCDERPQRTLSISRGSRGQPSCMLTPTRRPTSNRTEHKGTVPFQTRRLVSLVSPGSTQGVNGLTYVLFDTGRCCCVLCRLERTFMFCPLPEPQP